MGYYLTEPEKSKLTRRSYLKYVGGAVAAAAVAAAGYGLNSTSQPQAPTTQTITQTAIQTQTATAKAGYFWGDTPFEMVEEWYWTLNRAALAYASVTGDRLMTIDPHMHLESQAKDVAYMTELGIDGLMGCPIDPEGAIKTFEDVKAKGIPIATYDGSANTSAIDISIRVDARRLGKQLGEAFAKKMIDAGAKLEGNLFMIYHGEQNPFQTDRMLGMLDGLQQYSGLNILKYACESSQEKAKTAVFEAAQSQGRPTMVMATNMTQFIGAVEGLQSANMAVPRGQDGHVWVAGVDCGQEILKFIKDGLVDVGIDQPNLWYGTLAMRFLRMIKEKGASALPNFGQTVISDPALAEGTQTDGTYNVVIPDFEYKGVRPFQYRIFAPCPCVEEKGHRWLQVNSFIVDETNTDTAPIWTNVAKAWF
jgi:ABC-type sugar transport system substrate-binding protein